MMGRLDAGSNCRPQPNECSESEGRRLIASRSVSRTENQYRSKEVALHPPFLLERLSSMNFRLGADISLLPPLSASGGVLQPILLPSYFHSPLHSVVLSFPLVQCSLQRPFLIPYSPLAPVYSSFGGSSCRREGTAKAVRCGAVRLRRAEGKAWLLRCFACRWLTSPTPN